MTEITFGLTSKRFWIVIGAALVITGAILYGATRQTPGDFTPTHEEHQDLVILQKDAMLAQKDVLAAQAVFQLRLDALSARAKEIALAHHWPAESIDPNTFPNTLTFKAPPQPAAAPAGSKKK